MDPKQWAADLSQDSSLPKEAYKDPDDGRQRFLLELEFIQCLANPTYINYLAQNRYFDDEAFIGYLKYLQYWQHPEYVKFIMYPHCLFFLELQQNANFRNAMAHPQNKGEDHVFSMLVDLSGSTELTHRQQFYFWKNYRNNRLKHILPRPLPEAAPPPPTSEAAAATAPAQTMPPAAPAVSSLPKVENTRGSGGDRRKRKHGN